MKIKTFIVLFIFSLPLLGCNKDIISTEKDFKLKVSEHLTLQNYGTITLIKIMDSRCPPDVQCIRAGEAIADVSFKSNGGDITQLRVCTGSDCKAFHLTEEALITIANKPYKLVLKSISFAIAKNQQAVFQLVSL